jgi:chorismate synthase
MDNSPYSEKEMEEYRLCPEMNFKGGHMGGISTCVFCAEIYRRYRMKEGKSFSEPQSTQEE